MWSRRNIPFATVCARLGVLTDDGRVLVDTQANRSSLAIVRDIPLLIKARDGHTYISGNVECVEVVGNSVLAHGQLWPDKTSHWYVTALRAGDIHMNPDIDTVDMERCSDGIIRFWQYRIRALTISDLRSAWGDLPYTRIRLW